MSKLSTFWKLNKLWVFLALPLIVLILILNFAGAISNSQVMGFSAIIGTIYLAFSLIPANLKYTFKGIDIIKKLTLKRREIGISAGFLFFFHSIFGIVNFIDLSSGTLPPIQYLFGAIANYIFIFLLVTSFFGIRAKWKAHWNLWHAMVWMALPLILMHAGLNSFIKEGNFFSPIVILYILLIIFAFVKSFLPNSFNKDDIKRDYIWAILGLILTGTLVISSWGQVNDIFNASTTESAGDTLVLDDSTLSTLKFVSAIEVAQNNSKDSCYVSYKDIVYDVTDYIKTHPGGNDILRACGTNIDSLNHSPSVTSSQFQNVLKDREIGKLGDGSEAINSSSVSSSSMESVSTTVSNVEASSVSSSLSAPSVNVSSAKSESIIAVTKISADTVASNNSRNSCYISYDGMVYDMTDFISSHPGGNDILRACGTNIDNLRHSPSVSSTTFQNELKTRSIGELE